jgi:hypothetical protein
MMHELFALAFVVGTTYTVLDVVRRANRALDERRVRVRSQAHLRKVIR